MSVAFCGGEERLVEAHPKTDPLRAATESSPDKVAVIDLATNERLTYVALSDLADRAAWWIVRRLNAALGRRIVYLGRNGLELLVLALGAERCGAIFAPLNWRLTRPELTALIDDCEPDLTVAQTEFSDLLRGRAVIVDPLPQVRATFPFAHSDLPIERPIIILYTSGTTGQPKGVIVTARNATAAAQNFAAVGQVGPDAVMFSDLPMFHTIGLVAVTRTTLMEGGTLVLADRFTPSRTLGALADRDLAITHYFAVPAMVEALERQPEFDPAALNRLRAVFVGGAPLPPRLIERFLDFGVPLVNGYGMSEVGTAIHVPIDPQTVRANAGAIGLPAPGIDVRLVRDGCDVAPGEVGEIWLRGPSVTPGYWRRPMETAGAFSDGWYRSGDLARHETNGFYRLVDRLKDMYVSGGENVYPAEVEAVLSRAPGVADTAVLGVPHERWGETGIAFVVTLPSETLDMAALALHCSANLAKYKCPSRFIAVPKIPRSAAGKILKTVLREQLDHGDFS